MKKTFILNFFFFIVTVFFCCGQSDKNKKTFEDNAKDSDLLSTLLKSHPKEFQSIITNSKYEVQIIYTQINRDKNNVPTFTPHYYKVSAANYFYPASLVKLPCSALALEKMNNLAIPSLSKYSRMQTDSANVCQKKMDVDTSAQNGIPSIANYIKRMLLVSDNDAYSRIYEFLGQKYISDALTKKGYSNARITHRFDVECNTEQNKCTNPVRFYDDKGKCIYSQAMQTNTAEISNPLGTIRKGKGYVDRKGKLVLQPKDYTFMNYLCLQDIQSILSSLIFPDNTPKEKTYNLTSEDYIFLYRYMSMMPRESDYPRYNSKEFNDSYKKYFMYGDNNKKIEKDTVRSFNIVGQSYGYLSDCAYIINPQRNIEFMLAAVIYVNDDNIINDGKYEYTTIGLPFLSNLGKVIYEYEYNRKKVYLPDLSKFKLPNK